MHANSSKGPCRRRVGRSKRNWSPFKIFEDSPSGKPPVSKKGKGSQPTLSRGGRSILAQLTMCRKSEAPAVHYSFVYLFFFYCCVFFLSFLFILLMPGLNFSNVSNLLAHVYVYFLLSIHFKFGLIPGLFVCVFICYYFFASLFFCFVC